MGNKVTLITLYDTYEFDPSLRTGFGFSCYAEASPVRSNPDKNRDATPQVASSKRTSKKILFDTGSESETLLFNMKQLGIDPKDIDAVILSHSHGDHIGGLHGFLRAAGFKAKVYKPIAFRRPTQIYEGIYSTGAVGGFEQALAIETPRGLVVISGCAHPGIALMVRKAKEISQKIYLVLGGFHLGDATAVIADFKALGVEKVAPCHCTGDLAIGQFKEEYKDNFVDNGVGCILKF